MDYGVHRADSARSIGFMGTRAKADFDGTDWHIAAGIGHTIDLTEKSSITPSLRLDYTNFRTDSYTEKGAGALNNHVKSAVYEEFLLDMGAKFTHQLNDNGLKFIANGGVAYDFINETAQATSNLIGGGPSFVTRGLDPSPWLYRGGLGLVKAADSGMEVSARYDVEGRSSDYINQTASVNLRWSF
jgi:outer membrane autotransporter protein